MPSPFVIDGTLGVDLNRVDDKPAFKVGLQCAADDGHDYCYVSAPAAVAANTNVLITEPGFTVAAAGAAAAQWSTTAAAPGAGQYCWVRRIAL